MITQTYIVNMRVGAGIAPKVKISQGDIGRNLAFKLFDGVSAFTLPAGSTAEITGRKPSGLGFSENCTMSGNTVTVSTTLDISQESGNVLAELKITNGSAVVGTANFVIYVEPAAHPDGTTDGTTAEARTVLERCESYAQQAQEAAEAASGDYTEIRSDVDDLTDRVEALEAGGGGLSASVKNALLACFDNVAWKDTNGQTYYDALEDALFPEDTLSSISAVYVQSGTVYFDTPLNDLKTDLVVTAHYSNGTSATVSSGYTLTGILTAGTSAITVEYGGKTTTFNVTVTAVLYPFENGTHNFTNPASQITVSNGNTAVITASTANHNDTHANISELSTNTTACNATGNYTGISEPYFTISAGSTLSCKATITKLVYPISTSNAALAFRDMNGTAVLIMFANYNLSNMTVGQEFSESITVESATDIGCVGLFLGRKANGSECEIGVKIEAYLDGVRII